MRGEAEWSTGVSINGLAECTLSVGVCLRGLAILESSVPVFMLSLHAVATLACIMINLLPRRDLAEAGNSLEEGGEVRGGARPVAGHSRRRHGSSSMKPRRWLWACAAALRQRHTACLL